MSCFCTGRCRELGYCPSVSIPNDTFPANPYVYPTDTAPATITITQTGWRCPNCGMGVAPFMPYCPNCYPKKQPDGPTA